MLEYFYTYKKGDRIDHSMKKSGVLLHISSLHGDYGCGNFGKEAYEFADYLHDAGFTIWQVLPFNVPHKDASPYSSVSTFAQNPLFIDPEQLASRGLLTANELEELRLAAKKFEKDYYSLSCDREKYLRLAASRLSKEEKKSVTEYVNSNKQISNACKFLSQNGEEDYLYYSFIQYEFACQWDKLHKYLAERSIEVIGDIPIYADLHSSEVAYNPECFLLSEDGEPEFVSGVPGDAFNDEGQKWGHPLYCTDALKAQNYELLFDRMKFASSVYDLTRIDHFQAIAMFYCIPKDGHPREGHWERGVGEPFVKRLADEIGRDRFIVEDFNCFPGGSHALAEKYGFPDMNTLQFTLGAGKLPGIYPENTVAYTGTHDNDTLVGYLTSLPAKRLRVAAKALGLATVATPTEVAKAGIEALLACPADRTVIQAQDLLLEGSEGRMNVPGISGHGNWTYRITKEKMQKLRTLAPSHRALLKKHGRI